MQTVPARQTANDNDVVTQIQRASPVAIGTIIDHMGRNLNESGSMGDEDAIAVRLAATMTHLRSLAAQMPCNARVGRLDLWEMVGRIACRILPFATSIHEFDEECHRIRSFVGQALTQPAFAVSGSSRMGSLSMTYATMPGMVRITVTDGTRTTGFGLVLDEDADNR